MSNPLSIQSDPNERHMRLETLNIVPRNSSDTNAMWILPHRGYLSQDSRIVLPATCVSPEYQYSPYAGVLSLIKTATLRVGDVVVAQLDEANKFYAAQLLTHHLERRENVDLPIYGVHSSYETGSGSKWDTSAAETLPGQYRMVASDYEEQAPSNNHPGRKNLKPNILSAKIGEAYKLKTFYNDKTNEAGTPEFAIELGTLFPGYFQNGAHMLPLQLINPNDEIAIELTFSNNDSWNSNERAILCPDLQTAKTGVMNVGMVTAGAGFDANLVNQYKVPDNQADNPQTMKIKYDTDANGVPTNISVVQPGSGYTYGEELTFTKDGGGGTAMVLAAAYNIEDHTQAQNFTVLVQGANYVAGDATLVHPVNPACNVPCTIVVANGGVTDVSISESNAKIFYAAPSESVQYQITSDVGDGNARCRVNSDVYDVTANNLAGVFVVGDVIENTNNQSRAVVLEVNANIPTVIDILEGDWMVGYTVRKVSDNAVTCVLTVINVAPGEILDDEVGMGPSGLQGYDDVSGGKINIVSDKCRLITDLVFFEDNTVENDMKQMMNGGLTQIYTQYVNINSSIDGASVGDYGSAEKTETTRLIGFSSEILRDLIIQNYSSGTQDDDEFKYKGMAKRNPLMLDYHSRSSLQQDGVQLQVTINSLPRYPAPLSQSQHIFIESSQAFQKPLYIPSAMWTGQSSCKQTDTKSQTADSSQPGYSTLDSIFDASSQYEINDRKAGVCNQTYEGVNQQFLIGNAQYTGFNFRKIDGQNYKGNGVLVGNAPVEIRFDYSHTKNPWYSGKSILNVYGNCERVFLLRNGRVSVTSASM